MILFNLGEDNPPDWYKNLIASFTKRDVRMIYRFVFLIALGESVRDVVMITDNDALRVILRYIEGCKPHESFQANELIAEFERAILSRLQAQ